MRRQDLMAWFEAHRSEEVSPWIEVTQDLIDRYAELSGDDQWLHVDVERAGRESPFGGTVAHGFLLLSLITRLFAPLPSDAPVRQGVNYGLDRLRFTAPVLSGKRIRGRRSITELHRLPEGGVKVVAAVVIEVEGGAKPACVFDSISLYFP